MASLAPEDYGKALMRQSPKNALFRALMIFPMECFVRIGPRKKAILIEAMSKLGYLLRLIQAITLAR